MTVKPPLVLGIETSCDETAVALVTEADEGHGGKIIAQHVASQVEVHTPFAGVVPEMAARAHVDKLDALIAMTLDDAGVGLRDVDAIAATSGPGLVGGVLVGLMTAKALASAAKKPLLAINHLEGHALTARLTDGLAYPYLLLLVSGGHTQILKVEALGSYVRYGTTLDDALGEAFDKTAKLLELGFPGGPFVERAAGQGDPKRFRLPRPLKGREGSDFSFAGLKTAVRQVAQEHSPLSDQDVADLCASFQDAVTDVLEDRLRHALQRFQEETGLSGPLVAAGGVAANASIRAMLEKLAQDYNTQCVAPPLALCTDNAAMIAWAGLERFQQGQSDALTTPARARWPLDESQSSLLGSGKRGPKA